MFSSKKYLNSFGWQEGNALKEGGLLKPVLTSRKYDTRGLGTKHDYADQWWDNIFSSQLKSIQVNAGNGNVQLETKGTSNKLAMAKYHSKYSALSTVFRYAGCLSGTIEEEKEREGLKNNSIQMSEEQPKDKRSKKKSSRKAKSGSDEQKLKDKKHKRKRKDSEDSLSSSSKKRKKEKKSSHPKSDRKKEKKATKKSKGKDSEARKKKKLSRKDI
ncbi:ribosome biogenesis protein [Schizosaccharomyces cryophilus OY26]|uniref:Ribosome biogenesis protein n=1 Tax=Schizosaccharomyces cryophilus (strain OY26 / ATCC MYA-4695 / CBS 11777 / NBRC 106824 / NRRL Y48691) TaxID=653667 RepID=S9W3R3_SCHCR|nr:ribosome biogenesis protein [Schizosaccharomyces cryophilus OY26]EPY52580.1 ribosome biogenesis protein [Schizosaccharomyces cryophilus OY26]